MSRRTRRPLDLVRLEDRTTPTGFQLTEDYNPGPAGSDPSPLIAFGDRLVTMRKSGDTYNLDAVSPAGTTRLLSGIDYNYNAGGFAELGGKLYFPALVPGQGYQLYATDGTSPATAVTSLNTQSKWGLFPQELQAFNGALFFFGQDVAGPSLYRFDGAGVNTVYQFNQASDPGPFWQTNPHGLRGGPSGTLYFAAADNAAGNPLSGHGDEPWVSDGTPGGTRMLADLYPDHDPATGLPNSSSPRELVVSDLTVYFSAAASAGGRSLFAITGPAEQPVAVGAADLPAGSDPTWLTPFNGGLAFTATTPDRGREGWATDGTNVLGTDLRPGPDGSSPEGLTVAGDHLFFRADDGFGRGLQPFALGTDGSFTNLPINLFRTPFATTAGDDFHLYTKFAAAGDRIVFPANDGTTGLEPWVSDGTAAGTTRLAELNPTGDAFTLYSVTSQAAATAGGVTYLAATDGSHGIELFAGDVAPSVPPAGSFVTTTVVSASPNPAVAGKAVTFTAIVGSTAGVPTPTGDVTFRYNNIIIGFPHTKLNDQGRATVTESLGFVANAYSVTAEYFPTGSYKASTSDTYTLLVGSGTGTRLGAVSVSPGSVPQNQPATFSVTVQATSGSAVPTGSVTFRVGGGVLGTALIDAGSATLTTAVGLAPNTYVVQAYYGGDGGFAGADPSDPTSVTVTAAVVPTATATTITGVPPAAVVPGQKFTLTAQVTPASGTLTAGGTVTFFVGASQIGKPVDVGASGRVEVSGSVTGKTGDYPVTATYSGSGNYASSRALDGPTLTVKPKPFELHGVKLTITGAPSRLAFGESAVVTIQATPEDTTDSIPGSVTFSFDGPSQDLTLVNGRATVTITAPRTPFNYIVSARYGGGTVESAQKVNIYTQTAAFQKVVVSAPVPPPAQTDVILPPANGGGLPPSKYGVLALSDPTQVVWLDFGGGTELTNLGGVNRIVLPAFDPADLFPGFASYPSRQQVIDAVVAQIRGLFAGLDVQFTTTRPASEPYMTVAVGGDDRTTKYLSVEPDKAKKLGPQPTVTAYNGGIRALARGFDFGNRDLNDAAMVFPKRVGDDFVRTQPGITADDLIRQFGVTIAHEIGHNLGLRHLAAVDVSGTGNNNSLLSNGDRNPDAVFENADHELDPFFLPDGRQYVWYDRATQENSYAKLFGVLGPAPLPPAPPGVPPVPPPPVQPAPNPVQQFFIEVGNVVGGLFNGIIGFFGGAADKADGGGGPLAAQVYTLPDGVGRIPVSLPLIALNGRYFLYASSTPGGPIDIFSGTPIDGDLPNGVEGFELYGPDGGWNQNIPLCTGTPGALQPCGFLRLTPRDGFVQRVATDPRAAATVYAIGADAGAIPLVRVLDGRNGLEYSRLLAYDESFTGGVRVATADVNADGMPDVIAGAGPGGGPRIRVFDGLTRAPVPGPLGDFFAYEDTFRGGVTVAVGDVNGDGYQDVVVGSGLGGGPRVRVFSGADGSVIRDFFAYEDSFRGGVNVSVADVNGDGLADIAVGSGVGGGPRVRVFSGADLSELANYFAYEDSFRGGVNVALGDVDGDATPDVVAGSGVGGGPVVSSFSVKTGAELASQFVFGENTRTGIRVATVRTSDTATKASIVVAPGPGSGPRVRVIDGVTGAVSADAFAFTEDFLGGVFVG